MFDGCGEAVGPDLAAHVGPAGWARLAPAARWRFGAGQVHRTRIHHGTLDARRSSAGLVFAVPGRALGGPLPCRQGIGVPAEVRVRPDGAGMVWERLLTLYAVGVGGWSLRNALTTWRLLRLAQVSVPPTVPAHGPAVLVTGGTGSVGQALVRRLAAEGRRVKVLFRDAPRARALLGGGVHVVESLDALLPETRLAAIVNPAGAPVAGGWWTRRRRRVLLDEAACGRPGEFQSDLCRAWEMKAARAEAYGVRVVALRFGLVLWGPAAGCSRCWTWRRGCCGPGWA